MSLAREPRVFAAHKSIPHHASPARRPGGKRLNSLDPVPTRPIPDELEGPKRRSRLSTPKRSHRLAHRRAREGRREASSPIAFLGTVSCERLLPAREHVVRLTKDLHVEPVLNSSWRSRAGSSSRKQARLGKKKSNRRAATIRDLLESLRRTSAARRTRPGWTPRRATKEVAPAPSGRLSSECGVLDPRMKPWRSNAERSALLNREPLTKFSSAARPPPPGSMVSGN